MVWRICPLVLLLMAVVVAKAQDRVRPAPSAATAAVANENGAVDADLAKALAGEWKVRWPHNGWEATRTINADGTFTSSDAGSGTWTVRDGAVVLKYRRSEERFELPIQPQGTKVVGWKNREYMATKLDALPPAPKADIPALPKVATTPPPAPKVAMTPQPATARTPIPATPRPFVAEATATGIHRIDFKARIDSMAWIVVQDGKMHLDSRGSAPAERITVNGRKWTAAFNQGVSEDFKFGEPLLPFNGKTVSARLLKSRGSANILEQPTDANGLKLVIQLEDRASGAGDFDLVITW